MVDDSRALAVEALRLTLEDDEVVVVVGRKAAEMHQWALNEVKRHWAGDLRGEGMDRLADPAREVFLAEEGIDRVMPEGY